MLRNFVQETCNAPGTSASVNLAGAPTGRVTFVSQFANGTVCFYGMDDGTQAECGYGTFSTGTPNTFSRDQVLWNSAGTTSRLNFTGTTKIYNDVPAERFVYRDTAGNVSLPGKLSATNGASGTEVVNISQFAQALGAASGYINLPGGLVMQWGSTVVTIASNTATVTFPVAFASNVFTVVVSNGDLNAFNGLMGQTATSLTTFTVGTPALASGSVRVNWVAFGK